jgi:hypothetical protein
MSDSSNTIKSVTNKASAAPRSVAAGRPVERGGGSVTWADLTTDAILAHLRSVLRGLRAKGVPVQLVQTETGVTITIALASLAKPVAAPSAAEQG